MYMADNDWQMVLGFFLFQESLKCFVIRHLSKYILCIQIDVSWLLFVLSPLKINSVHEFFS